MQIVADQRIGEIKSLLPEHELLCLPATAITRTQLMQADALLVRSVTAVNATLLEGTPVKFVGTATSGIDHLDVHWLQQAGIAWGSAQGANAAAVIEYVLCVIAALYHHNMLRRWPGRVGVIGAGMIGARVAAALTRLGFSVLVNDPPRADCSPGFVSVPLEEFNDLDLICVHAQLVHAGPYPSYHLLDHHFLQRQRPGCALINAARGSIVDTEALLTCPQLHACIDVWEHEPYINMSLLQRAWIATPHIAGYSVESKRRAAIKVCQQLQQFFGEEVSHPAELPMNSPSPSVALDAHGHWLTAAYTTFDLPKHTAHLRATLMPLATQELRAQAFEASRHAFAQRHEFLRFPELEFGGFIL